MVGQIKQFLSSRSLQTNREKSNMAHSNSYSSSKFAWRPTPLQHKHSDAVIALSVSDSPPWYVQRAPGVAQRLRHRQHTISLGQPPWYILRAPGVAQQLRHRQHTISLPQPPGIFNVPQEVARQRRSTPHKAPSTLLGKWVPILPTHLPITIPQCTKWDRTWCRVSGG